MMAPCDNKVNVVIFITISSNCKRTVICCSTWDVILTYDLWI